MTPRRVAVLFVCGLLVIAGAIWLSSRRHLERATLAADLVLPGLEAGINAVSEVDLRRGDGTRTSLKKASSGWVVGEREWAAEPGKVRKLLLDLGALNVVVLERLSERAWAALKLVDVVLMLIFVGAQIAWLATRASGAGPSAVGGGDGRAE